MEPEAKYEGNNVATLDTGGHHVSEKMHGKATEIRNERRLGAVRVISDRSGGGRLHIFTVTHKYHTCASHTPPNNARRREPLVKNSHFSMNQICTYVPYCKEDQGNAEDQRQHVAKGSKSEHIWRGKGRIIPQRSTIPLTNIYSKKVLTVPREAEAVPAPWFLLLCLSQIIAGRKNKQNNRN